MARSDFIPWNRGKGRINEFFFAAPLRGNVLYMHDDRGLVVGLREKSAVNWGSMNAQVNAHGQDHAYLSWRLERSA